MPEFDFMGAVAAAMLYVETVKLYREEDHELIQSKAVGQGDTCRYISKMFNINFPVASRISATATLASADPARALG